MKMRVFFLGTNGWYDTNTGSTTCTLVESDEYVLILDAGNGIYNLDRYIPAENNKPVYLFLSHFHLDHVIGLHILNKFNSFKTLHIFGKVGTRRILQTFMNDPFTVPVSMLPFRVEIHELTEGIHRIPFRLECRLLLHSSSCMGYRFELDGRTLAYCPDTGVCENAITLAKAADLLISECAFKAGQSSPEWPHLNPESAAFIANEAGARKLVLTHFDANIYRTLDERISAESRAREIFSNTFVATDGMEVEV